ncbi:MAG: outer membrane protein assembly factor BamE [Pseudomonadota bacterium]
MRNDRTLLRTTGLIAALCVMLAACSPITRSHGYTPSDLDLAQLTVGKDTRDSVAQAVGSPFVDGLTDSNTWYYVSSVQRTNGAFTPQEIDRQVVAITFTEAGDLANIERFGLQEGRVVTLSRRVTNPAVQNSTFIRQLFDSLGNIPTDQFL